MLKPATHALILEATTGSMVTVFEIMRGSQKQTVAAHKKWLTEINKDNWINIPGDLPVTISKSTIIGLRVAIVPPEIFKAEEIEKRWEGDPRRAAYMNKFVGNAQKFGKQIEEEPDGVDLLDKGYKI